METGWFPFPVLFGIDRDIGDVETLPGRPGLFDERDWRNERGGGDCLRFSVFLCRRFYRPPHRTTSGTAVVLPFVLLATLYFLALSYTTPTTELLYVGIALLWGSYGMATIVVYTTAMDCVRPGREGTDFTIQTVITHLSGMLMAILSGKIADHTGYHGLFFFEVSLAALSLVYILIVFRKEKETV